MQDFFHQRYGSVDILASTIQASHLTFKRPHIDALHLQVWYRHLRKKENQMDVGFNRKWTSQIFPVILGNPWIKMQHGYSKRAWKNLQNTHHFSISFMSVFQIRFQAIFNHHHGTCNSFLVKAFDILPTGKPARTLTSIYPPIQKKCIFWGMLHHRVPYKFPHSKVHWNSPPAQRTRRCAPHNGVLMGLLLIPGHGSFEKERGKPRHILFTGILWACPCILLIFMLNVSNMFIDDASREPV